MRGRGRGARVSEFFSKNLNLKKNFFFWGGGVWAVGVGVGGGGGLELVNFYSKNQNLKIEFFYGGGSERARVSDFVTTYPHVKMLFYFLGGGARVSEFFFKESKYNKRKKVFCFFLFVFFVFFFFCFFFWGGLQEVIFLQRIQI